MWLIQWPVTSGGRREADAPGLGDDETDRGAYHYRKAMRTVSMMGDYHASISMPDIKNSMAGLSSRAPFRLTSAGRARVPVSRPFPSRVR